MGRHDGRFPEPAWMAGTSREYGRSYMMIRYGTCRRMFECERRRAPLWSGGIYRPFLALAGLCLARGEGALSKTTQVGACHTVAIDRTWSAWFNPHATPARFTAGPGQMDGEVPPFSAWINYNGWLWGIIDPDGGTHGEHPREGAGNLASFMAAVRLATEAAHA